MRPMQLKPRYGTDPVITLDGSASDVLMPAVRQRRRLAAALASFDEAQWSHQSRCDGWSSRDVIVHLNSTNTFWAFAIGAGLRGEPTQFLATFDPVASPAQLVNASPLVSTSDLLAEFTASTEALATLLESLDSDGWTALAEAPPGHISVSAVVHHALWDSWVHERDILLPLGIEPMVEADEVAACLRYVAALGPAFAINNSQRRIGALAVDVTEPDVCFTVRVGERAEVHAGVEAGVDLTLTGDAVELLEALSVRAPLRQHIPNNSSWLLAGLLEIFESDRA
jgi:uncharacterized protein (TIGR03083 family)